MKRLPWRGAVTEGLTHISGNLWVDYVILVVMTLVSAIAVEWFWKCVPVQKLSGLLMKEKAV